MNIFDEDVSGSARFAACVGDGRILTSCDGKVVVASEDGTVVGQLEGEFQSPEGICVLGDGRIVVADESCLRIYARDLTFQRTVEGFNRPMRVAVGKEDRIYVADKGNNRIQVLDKEFEAVSSIESPSPTGVAVYDDPRHGELVHVCEPGKVKVFRDGEVFSIYGGLSDARDVQISSFGIVYIIADKMLYTFQSEMFSTGFSPVSAMVEGRVVSLVAPTQVHYAWCIMER